jgi:hypothetical protein
LLNYCSSLFLQGHKQWWLHTPQDDAPTWRSVSGMTPPGAPTLSSSSSLSKRDPPLLAPHSRIYYIFPWSLLAEFSNHTMLPLHPTSLPLLLSLPPLAPLPCTLSSGTLSPRGEMAWENTTERR